MAKKNQNYYFESFVKLFDSTVEASNYLEEVIKNFNGKITNEQMNKMHTIEHTADLCFHEILEKLSKEFITPIERDDIIAICRGIEEATDSIEEVLINIYLHNLDKLYETSLEFTAIIKNICQYQHDVLVEFPNFKKSNILKDKIMKVFSEEEKGDKVYMSSIKNIYANTLDFKELYLMESLIQSFEKCCDAVHLIAQLVDEAVMKNS